MFHSSITIDAPPEAVFDELSHVERPLPGPAPRRT
jgi:hypothetical protein